MMAFAPNGTFPYFGDFDLKRTKLPQCSRSTDSACIKERREVENTVLVIRSFSKEEDQTPGHAESHGRICIPTAKPLNLDQLCTTVYGQSKGWCEPRSAEHQRIERSLSHAATLWDGRSLVLCSGVMLGPDRVATVEHCVHGNSGWVVAGYTHGSDNKPSPDGSMCFPAEDVYRINGRAQDYESVYGHGERAVVLDVQPLAGGSARHTAREGLEVCDPPLAKRPEADEARVYMRGHPLGLPQYHAGNASIVHLAPPVIKTSLDALHGFSGAPIFDARSNCLVGIQVSIVSNFFPDEGCCRFVSDTPGHEVYSPAAVGLRVPTMKPRKPKDSDQ